ncbi:MAG: aspartate aminotransferase family protein [Caulobacterales bacterium]|nr:aspartate aminotransferase family protein [Caulobacterales bacterium]MCA0372420.1 aspartate aminotransferase family protein [Pseudomonadota bacterium]
MTNTPDLKNYWMPFTANRQFKENPRLLVSADGMFYKSHDDRTILDGTAGLWTVNAGHGRKEIVDAVARQMSQLDYAPSFQMGHPISFEFATRLAKIAPDGFGHVFFTNSGSESVETALKIALAYHQAKGDGRRVRLIGRERAYHGVNFGGISVGGLVNNRRVFQTLPYVDHLPHTHLPENAFAKGQPEHGKDLAKELDRIAALHGPETIAAVIVEPVAGSTGVLVPPKGYLEELRAACDRVGCLLIFDEVITGYGRIGTPFASQFFGVQPDIFTTAKGINNGYLPMGAVFAHDKVHDAFMKGPEQLIELFHGYTCSGHPAACAAGLATMDIMEREGLFNRAATISPIWEKAAHSLNGTKHVIDVRNIGLIAGIELAAREGAIGARGYEAFVKCYEQGVLVRVTGDIIALSPPLIIEEEHIAQLFETIKNVLATID